MSDPLNYIDDYFTGRLSPAEKEVFENRCESDPVFAQDVVFMISARDELKRKLYAQKKEQFADLYNELSGTKTPKITIFRKLIPYMSAACLFIVVALVLSLQQPSPQSLAKNYIDKNLNTLSATMGNSDSVQTGIEAYNNKDYIEAERIFKTLITNRDVENKVSTNLGIVYMVTERYDEALLQFDRLSKQPDLRANPGLFYKALVLMRRSTGDDKKNAKNLLQEVIRKDLPGRKDAEIWIKHL